MRNIQVNYTFEPTGFDYVNQEAEVVIVGITPGNSQLKGKREGLDKREIKRQNAFAGNMRPILIMMELKERGIISAPIIAIAHPSGGNMGRICCYLGTKEPRDASYEWCEEKAKEAKTSIAAIK